MTRATLVYLTLFMPAAGLAQTTKKLPDHGRVLATAIDVYPHKLKDTTKLAETKNYVFRGKVISLGKDKRVSICYDVEHLRVAGAWVGKPMVFAADKNMGPTVEGTMLFATKPGPGWANPQARSASKGTRWADPREGKEGPLPRDWAHYKGMYLHGDKVVLSYTVGDMDVLEMPEAIETNGIVALKRTFEFGPTKSPQTLLIAEKSRVEPMEPKATPTKRPSSTEWMVWTSDHAFLVHVKDSAKRKMLRTDEMERVIVEIPAMPKGGSISVSHVRLSLETKYSALWGWIEKANKAAIANIASYTKGGPARWTETLETAITRGDDKVGPYVVDQIALPTKNPWNASIRFAGLDFFPDGRAALSTWDGDVWIVSGLDGKTAKWKRFASGLQVPLGLKIVNGIIHVAGRDQITRLHDLNGDGEADFYENFNNAPGLTLQRHEFVMDLETDKDGNFYYCRSGHYIQSKRGDNCVIYKLSPDGKKIEKFARGFREPNGLSIGPDGTMTVADNEGNGIPQTPIYRLKPGADYGFTPSKSGKVNEGTWKQIEKPMVWLGPKIDTSAGGQVWVPLARRASKGTSFGPLAGLLLHTSYGNCALFSVLIDKTAEPWQAAVWKFPLSFESGIMRARFHPIDGQLYLCGLRGWGTSAVKDGQFCRVRYTGKSVPIPVGYRVVKSGIKLSFSDPLDKAAVEDDDNWAGTWSGVLKKVPAAKEKQEMPITSVRLAADRKTVTIAVEKLRVVPNFTLQYRLKAADGAKVSGEVNGTIQRIP